MVRDSWTTGMTIARLQSLTQERREREDIPKLSGNLGIQEQSIWKGAPWSRPTEPLR